MYNRRGWEEVGVPYKEEKGGVFSVPKDLPPPCLLGSGGQGKDRDSRSGWFSWAGRLLSHPLLVAPLRPGASGTGGREQLPT